MKWFPTLVVSTGAGLLCACVIYYLRYAVPAEVEARGFFAIIGERWLGWRNTLGLFAALALANFVPLFLLTPVAHKLHNLRFILYPIGAALLAPVFGTLSMLPFSLVYAFHFYDRFGDVWACLAVAGFFAGLVMLFEGGSQPPSLSSEKPLTAE